MRKELIIISFTVVLAFSLSCKKVADEPAPLAKSRTELLTIKPWKSVTSSVSPSYDIFGDGKLISGEYLSKAPICWRDDLWIFSSNGTFTQDEGLTKCNASDPQIYDTGTWKFESLENVVRIISKVDGETLWEVRELTATTLKVVEYYSEGGQKYTFEHVFSR